LLDLISEDCFRRDEPSLASLVVNGSTGEVLLRMAVAGFGIVLPPPA
jgi:hypothetical protein